MLQNHYGHWLFLAIGDDNSRAYIWRVLINYLTEYVYKYIPNDSIDIDFVLNMFEERIQMHIESLVYGFKEEMIID